MGDKNVRETALLFTKGQGEEVPDMGTEIPLQPVEKTMVTQVIPLACRGAGISSAASEGPHVGCRWIYLEGSCGLWKAPTGAGFWQEIPPMEGSPCRSRFCGYYISTTLTSPRITHRNLYELVTLCK